MSVDDKWSINKLDSMNCTTWKFYMWYMLLAKGLWGFVDGAEELHEEANRQAQADFWQMSQKTFSTITMAISTPQLYLVTSCDNPGEVWEALQNYFDRDTLANKLSLKKQYFCTEVTLLGSLL